MTAGVNKVPKRSSDNLSDRQKAVYDGAKQDVQNNTTKGLAKPSFFGSELNGGVIAAGEADSVVAQVQDSRYGTSLTGDGSGGDFASKIVIGVGFLNDRKPGGSVIDLSDPNLRYAAGMTVYQRTDVGSENIFIRDIESLEKIAAEDGRDELQPNQLEILDNSDNIKQVRETRKATSPTPQKAVSVVDITADVVEIKARNGGVNIIGGFDNTLPNFGGAEDNRNLFYTGVNLIGGGNPTSAELNDSENVRGLQPIPRGDNLVEAITVINRNISDLSNSVNAIIANQKILETVLYFHSHPVAGLGVAIAGPSIELGFAGIAKTVVDSIQVLKQITQKYNQIAFRVNTSEVSTKGLLSKWNKTN